MNVVMTGGGRFVEVQGTGEEATFSEKELTTLVKLARGGIAELHGLQRPTSASNGRWRNNARHRKLADCTQLGSTHQPKAPRGFLMQSLQASRLSRQLTLPTQIPSRHAHTSRRLARQCAARPFRKHFHRAPFLHCSAAQLLATWLAGSQ